MQHDGKMTVAGIPVADIAEATQLSRTSVYRSKTMVAEFTQSLDESSHDFQTVAITEDFLQMTRNSRHFV